MTKNDRNWWYVALGGWLLIIAMPVGFNSVGSMLSASHWITIDHIEVTDNLTKDGLRIVDYRRTLHRDFQGKWETTEEFLTPQGYTPVRVCVGETNYRKDRNLPSPLTLSWLVEEKTPEQLARGVPQNCVWRWPYVIRQEFPVGTYRLCVTVRPQTQFGEKKEQDCSLPYEIPHSSALDDSPRIGQATGSLNQRLR